MVALIFIGAFLLFGMILGQFFKCFVLFPATALAIVLFLASPAHMGSGFLISFLQFFVLITSLQIGYVIGLVARDLINQRRSDLRLNQNAKVNSLSSGPQVGTWKTWP